MDIGVVAVGHDEILVTGLGVGAVVIAGGPSGAGTLTALAADRREILRQRVVDRAWQSARTIDCGPRDGEGSDLDLGLLLKQATDFRFLLGGGKVRAKASRLGIVRLLPGHLNGTRQIIDGLDVVGLPDFGGVLLLHGNEQTALGCQFKHTNAASGEALGDCCGIATAAGSQPAEGLLLRSA